jgi:hypothetical protein
MYINRKMMSVEPLPGVGEEMIKENDRGGALKYDIFDIRTFVDATMYPQPAQK